MSCAFNDVNHKLQRAREFYEAKVHDYLQALLELQPDWCKFLVSAINENVFLLARWQLTRAAKLIVHDDDAMGTLRANISHSRLPITFDSFKIENSIQQ